LLTYGNQEVPELPENTIIYSDPNEKDHYPHIDKHIDLPTAEIPGNITNC
ncbi:MAG: hypothetical protein EZS28_032955, partial [Streblomastix strix]